MPALAQPKGLVLLPVLASKAIADAWLVDRRKAHRGLARPWAPRGSVGLARRSKAVRRRNTDRRRAWLALKRDGDRGLPLWQLQVSTSRST